MKICEVCDVHNLDKDVICQILQLEGAVCQCRYFGGEECKPIINWMVESVFFYYFTYPWFLQVKRHRIT